jgi:hypothetical protein
MNKITVSMGVASIVFLIAASSAVAAPAYSLFGEAALIAPGNGSLRAVRTVSDAHPIGYGGIDFGIPAGTKFSDLVTLSTDYNVTDDNCGGGSPRFEVAVTNGADTGNIFVYLGPAPSFTGCVLNTWVNTGNLLTGTNTVDTGQLINGTFYDPYTTALAKYGAYTVTNIALVNDGSWNAVATGGDGKQTVLFDNTRVNTSLYTYEANTPTSKDQCKNGGWMQLQNANGQPFKNQGECMSYFSRS